MGNQSSRKAGESASMSSSQQVSHTHARRSSDTSALIHGSTHLAVSQSQAQYNNKTSIGGGPTTPNPAAAGSHGAPGAQNYQHHSSTLDDTALLNTTGRAGSASTASAAQAAATAMSRSMHGVYQVDDDNVAGGYTRKRSNTLDIMGMRNINSGIEIPTGTNRKGVLPTVVRWKGGGKNVFIAGSFNNWKAKIPMVKSQNDFMMIIELPEGKHEYKFWVDGQWVHDPTANAVVNQYGSKHNYIDVKKSDFEVFEALEKDSEKAPKKEHNESFQTGSPPDSEYSQEIASRRIYDQTSGPPILPPHLRDVILNQNLPADYEPNLLPEPTHVMLNHMYALSIKDGVMVLSTTHRYRKKYVTTLLYKPIS